MSIAIALSSRRRLVMGGEERRGEVAQELERIRLGRGRKDRTYLKTLARLPLEWTVLMWETDMTRA